MADASAAPTDATQPAGVALRVSAGIASVEWGQYDPDDH